MKVLRKSLKVAGIMLLLALAIVTFQAYFVRSIDVGTGQTSDGLGRPLHDAPFLIKAILRESLWPGLVWHLADWVIFWGVLAAGFYLIGLGSDD